MNAFTRVCACAVILFTAVLFVGCFLVPWLGGPSLFPKDLHELCVTFLEQSRKQESLDGRTRRLTSTIEDKRVVTDDLIAGRITLAQAIDQFRQLRDDLESLNVEPDNAPWSAVSDADLARNVIAWVNIALHDDSRRDDFVRRLEAEAAGLR